MKIMKHVRIKENKLNLRTIFGDKKNGNYSHLCVYAISIDNYIYIYN